MTYPQVSTTGEHTGTAFGVPASPRFPQIEDAVLARWAADDTFAASVANRPTGEDGANEFVFYDGPPFANGLPHYGHLLTGYVKDIVPRYETMRGRHVENSLRYEFKSCTKRRHIFKQNHQSKDNVSNAHYGHQKSCYRAHTLCATLHYYPHKNCQ